MKLDTSILVLIDILIVIGLSRLVGLGFRRIKQPLVIGEIVAGVMLGPSLLGLIAPDFAAAIFPPAVIPFLGVLSQIGLIFFMFLIGLELDPKYLKSQIDVAVLTSHVSILVPFSLGTLLALLLYPLVSNNSVSFTAFALFLGAAMSITAFPVLARIITENNLQSTRLGTLALTCAAVDDVTAWCLLALAIAVARNSPADALRTMLLSAVYITFMLTIGRRFLQRFAAFYNRSKKLNQFALAGIYMGVVTSALITELIGIHLIFGAFLVGAVMPKHQGLTRELAQKTEDFVLTFLLPIFFAYSGLRTQIGLLNSPILWVLCGSVLAVAIAGKYCGTYVAARFCNIQNREASALGWLMNTRGLTELIVLNIGLSLGVISPLLFTMLVIMALVTTFMTSPLLEWTYPKHLIQQDVVEPITSSPVEADYQVLVPIANPSTQQGLIQLAVAIALGNQLPREDRSSSAAVFPLSLIPIEEDYAYQSMPAEVERLVLERQAELRSLINTLEPPELRTIVHPIVRAARDVAQETADLAERDRVDLILLGWHRPAFSKNRLGGRVGQILSMARADVAVFVDRQHDKLDKLLVPYVSNIHNDLGLEIALRLLMNCRDCHLTILRVAQDPQRNDLTYELRTLMDQLPNRLRDRIYIPQVEAENPINAVVDASAQADLTIAGASREWGLDRQTLGYYADELAVRCHSPLLITRRYSRVTSHLASMLEQDPSPSNPLNIQ
jgi:Kef-type K+ transport system membrane component KefB